MSCSKWLWVYHADNMLLKTDTLLTHPGGPYTRPEYLCVFLRASFALKVSLPHHLYNKADPHLRVLNKWNANENRQNLSRFYTFRSSKISYQNGYLRMTSWKSCIKLFQMLELVPSNLEVIPCLSSFYWLLTFAFWTHKWVSRWTVTYKWLTCNK